MGTFEKGDTDILEQNIVSCLNGQVINDGRTQKVSSYIKDKYSNIITAIWTGLDNRSSIGDIKLILSNKSEKYIELKYLKEGKGTKANLGQDTLSKRSLLDAEKWSTFRDKIGHYDYVKKIFNDYLQIQKQDKKVFKTKTSIYDFASVVKNKEDFITYKEKIIARDRREKLAYIDYLKNSKQNSEAIKTFVVNLFYGKHSEKNYDKNILDKEIKENYTTLYLYKDLQLKEEKNDVDIDNNDFIITFKDNTTTSIFISMKNKENNEIVDLFRIVFNWKNKFQGIQTPCLNVFQLC